MAHTWLRAGRLAVLAIAAASAPVAAQQTPAAPPATAPAARPSDVESPEAMMVALYDVITGPSSQARDWNRFRSLFLPGARLIYIQVNPDGSSIAHPLPVEDFIRLAGPSYLQGAGFWETGIGRRIDRFGNVAHIFSAYESRTTAPDGPVHARGINTVQLVRQQGRWWVASMTWDEERPDNPIPAEYLDRPGQ
jgi:hypothetical protein